jgi:hypothetical protein
MTAGLGEMGAVKEYIIDRARKAGAVLRCNQVLTGTHGYARVLTQY